ncbi:C40 family peptidase [Alicyclobacillus fastidiosus]|uniref:NlpC/P60 family protein n=1 Tax=Alicyclobacillus fastidiosus TaxID=392011 RepID=A0ABV5AIK7_9BACL
MHKTSVALGATALFALTPLSLSVAMAATSPASTVTVQHNAYLISAPKSGSTKIALETKGTSLTLLSGGNQYWYHVKDAQGRQGYITTTSYYTEKASSKASSASSESTTATSGTKATAATATSKTVVEVLHNAYLISAPKSGSAHVALEQTGTQLTIKSGSNQYWWHVSDASGHVGYITTNSYYTEEAAPLTVKLPPGVTIDPAIVPVASLTATASQKFQAVLQVAKSKLGTPYEAGHNEDRGQTGFDCSNYTAYVFHHALGYIFSTSSKTQYTSVGTKVAISDMQPGDLLTFDDGGHSGIYIGNNEMIQCGGGLGKVGYLSVAPGSYWYQHLSAVKRMF